MNWDAMRWARLLLLCVCWPATTHAQESPGLTRSNDEVGVLAVDYTAAWNSQSPTQVASFFSPGGSLTVNDGDPLVGREAIAGLAREFMTAFPDMVLLLDGVEVRGGRAIYRWRFKGTNSGPDGTGKRVDFSGFEVWVFGDDGLIARSTGFFDAAEYAYQVEHGIEERR